eukprot:m.191813 g.191813  ORF g.191813 m.191813 type:complete len:1039 (-) comp15157_c0_seq1:174-3290(-)
MQFVATVLTATSVVTAAAPGRLRSSFDSGWTFARDIGQPDPAPCPPFPRSVVGVQCLGLTEAPAPGVNTPDTCRAAACANGATIWQLTGGRGTSGQCWIGASCDQNLTAPEFGGEVRPPAPPTPKSCLPAGKYPCSPGYDDSGWRANLTVPHDFVVEGNISEAYDANYGGLRTGVAWYRKRFHVDRGLSSGLVWLTFDGVFRAADVYLNGAFVGHHEEGYTSFTVYLHNASAPLKYGPDTANENVLAVYVDATQHELWAYEGGGIYRHVWLEAAGLLSTNPWGFYAPTLPNGTITGDDVSQSQSSDSAVFSPVLDVQNAGKGVAGGVVTFTLTAPDGHTAVRGSTPFSIPPGGFLRVKGGPLQFGSASSPVELWNTAPSPPLYTATATITSNSTSPPTVVDSVSARVGVRSAVFEARRGFVLNGVPVKMQGVSMHLGFGGVGIAVPDRVTDFQVAALQNVGANAWRTAHNPVAPELLDACDARGMLVWEENRFITSGVQPVRSSSVESDSESDSTPQDKPRLYTKHAPGKSRWEQLDGHGPANRLQWTPPSTAMADPRLLQDAQDMALRDRNHPSIVIWSLCNELGCVADDPNGGVLAVQFKQAIAAADPSRPITGNIVQSPYLGGHLVDSFAQAMDVQSFSYDYASYDSFHTMTPWKPVGGGESGSCVVDRGQYYQNNSVPGYVGPDDRTLFSCVQAAWEPIGTSPFAYGNFLWTGFDYRGETSHGWPDVSSKFGLFDLAGFPKDHAGYYRAWWSEWDGEVCRGTPKTRTSLAVTDGWLTTAGKSRNRTTGDARITAAAVGGDRSHSSSVSVSVSPSDWTSPASVGAVVSVVVTTCADSVDLFLNGAQLEPRVSVPRYGFAEWKVPFHPGNLTAVAYDKGGSVAGVSTILTAGAPTKLFAWVEPAGSGDGATLAADGNDAAVIGVALLDADGVRVPDADQDLEVKVSSGPAVVFGTANGDPADHTANPSPSRRTFHGLARAVVGSAGLGMTGVAEVVVSADNRGISPTTVRLTFEAVKQVEWTMCPSSHISPRGAPE